MIAVGGGIPDAPPVRRSPCRMIGVGGGILDAPLAPKVRTMFPICRRGDHRSPATFPILSSRNIRKMARFHVKNQRFLTHSPPGNAAGDQWSPLRFRVPGMGDKGGGIPDAPYTPMYCTIFPLRRRGDHRSPATFPILSSRNIRKMARFHVKNQRFLTHSPAGNAAGDQWSPLRNGDQGASGMPPPTVCCRTRYKRADVGIGPYERDSKKNRHCEPVRTLARNDSKIFGNFHIGFTSSQ